MEAMRNERVGQILVADDDAAIRTVLNQALSRAGHGEGHIQRRRCGAGLLPATAIWSLPTW
jgi:DNA-binding NtrC family response regulator